MVQIFSKALLGALTLAATSFVHAQEVGGVVENTTALVATSASDAEAPVVPIDMTEAPIIDAAATLSDVDTEASAPMMTEAEKLAPNSRAERGSFGLFNAFSKEAPPQSLFPYTDQHKTFAPPRFLPEGTIGTKPIQTNDWWANMIGADSNPQVQPAWSNPYSVRPKIDVAPYGFMTNYPRKSRVISGKSGNGGASKNYSHRSLDELVFGATEFTSAPTFEVPSWDDLGAELRLYQSTKRSANLVMPLVSGMAYSTVKYTDLTPKVSTIYTVRSVNGAIAKRSAVYEGSRFVVNFNSDQTWVLYASSSVKFRVDGGSTFVFDGKFNGYLRAAYAPTDTSIATFDKYSTCIVEGADVEAKDDSAYTFLFKTSGKCAAGLLHYAHVHHLQSIDRSSASEAEGVISESTTRGKMQAFVTKTSPPVWKLVETEDIPVDFYPARKPTPSVVKSNAIYETLVSEINEKWKIPLNGSYYFNGKLAQKYAWLCLMANDPAIVGSDKSLLETCRQKLRTVISPMVNNKWVNEIRYDTVYRGLVSSEGFKKNEYWVDFGNTVYNDHHYHYGYWIVSAAIVNYLDPTWNQLAQLNRVIDFLVRDVANPSTEDPYFPKWRNFDWFRGHSYSHGVTPFADGKDEESTSEDINFHYGLYLYGKVTKNFRLEQMGKLMMKLNAHAIKTYFLISSDNTVHPKEFLQNRVTGIFFDNKVDYGSWFSPEKHCINGIQMIPPSPVTEFVRTKEFVQEEWSDVLARDRIVVERNATNGWTSLLYVNYASINKEVALEVLQTAALDDGLTRSWALYMAATRP
jgi:endo-1,3(4)-beta-glucanase